MDSSADCAIGIVGVGAIMPDAPNAPAFWENIKNKRYSISEVPAERWSVAWPRLAPVVLPGLLGRNVAAPNGLLPWLPDDLPSAIGRAFQDQHATFTRAGVRMLGADECAVVLRPGGPLHALHV